MSKVFVLDTDKKVLDPIHPAQARQLLRNQKAAIFKKFPFTIILKESKPDVIVQPLRIKIDPGSKTSGIALVNDATGEVVFGANLEHRGLAIKASLEARRGVRRKRRYRKTRYRKPIKKKAEKQRKKQRLERRSKRLNPSLMSRVYNIITWVKRLAKVANIKSISVEFVSFDMQKIRNPEIKGKEYQQGTLQGYEVRQYLLEKFGRKCVYCGEQGVPLQVEHIHPKSKGGSNSITNLTLSCQKCNQDKGSRDIKEFLKDDPKKLVEILKEVRASLADAAAVNTTKTKLIEKLSILGLGDISLGTGAQTQFNRTSQGLPKDHWIDAALVGESTPKISIKGVNPLLIKAVGHGNRQMCQVDKHGFPKLDKDKKRIHRTRQKVHFGFQTGDIVKAVVKKGKNAGTHIGKVSVRKTGQFDISTQSDRLQSINHKYCKKIHCHDGYSYSYLKSTVVHQNSD